MRCLQSLLRRGMGRVTVIGIDVAVAVAFAAVAGDDGATPLFPSGAWIVHYLFSTLYIAYMDDVVMVQWYSDWFVCY